VATLGDVVAHEDRTDLVSQRGLLDRDLQQGALRRVHRRVAQLVEVHLAESLQALEVVLVVRVLDEELRLGHVVVQVHLLLADEGRVQRWLSHVHVAVVHQFGHLAKEEREQQRADVTAVHVGVSEQDDLVVADLRHVELGLDAGADRRDQRLDLGVLQDFVRPGLLDVEDLPANRQDRLDARVARVLGRSPGRVPLDDEELALARFVRRAVHELARQAGAVEGALSTGEVARVARGLTGPLRLQGLGDDLAALLRILLEPVGQLLIGRALHERADRDVAQLALGLTLELRLGESHRHDGGEALADVLAR